MAGLCAKALGNPTINIPIPISKSNGSGGQTYSTKTITDTLLGCIRSFQSWKGKDEMAGGGHGESITYKGLTLHKPKRWHTLTGKGLCAVMWFWVFYRAKQDGPVVLGWRHPWEGHDDHGHGHGH